MSQRRPPNLIKDDLLPPMNDLEKSFGPSEKKDFKEFDNTANAESVGAKFGYNLNASSEKNKFTSGFDKLSNLIKYKDREKENEDNEKEKEKDKEKDKDKERDRDKDKDKDRDKDKDKDKDRDREKEKENRAKIKAKPKKKYKYKLSRDKQSEMNADDSNDESSNTITHLRPRASSKLFKDSESKAENKNKNSGITKSKNTEISRESPNDDADEITENNKELQSNKNKNDLSNFNKYDSDIDDSQSFSTAVQKSSPMTPKSGQFDSDLTQANITNFFALHRDQIRDIITKPQKSIAISKINKTKQRVEKSTRSASESFTETAKKVEELEVKFALMKAQMTETYEKANSTQEKIETLKQNMKNIIETVDSSLKENSDKFNNHKTSETSRSVITSRRKQKDDNSTDNSTENNDNNNLNEEENENENDNQNNKNSYHKSKDLKNDDKSEQKQHDDNVATERNSKLDQKEANEQPITFEVIKNKVVAFFVFIYNLIYSIWILFYDIMTTKGLPKHKRPVKKDGKHSKNSKKAKSKSKAKGQAKEKETDKKK